MELFVDFIGPDDRYRATGACFAAPALPVAVLGSAAFVEASHRAVAGAHRIFHVEGSRYVVEESLAAAGVGSYDSVVVVSPIDGVFPAPDEVRLRWFAAGGVARRLACFPVPAYAMRSTPSRWLC